MIKIEFLKNFLTEAKELNKVNKKLSLDLQEVEKELIKNPKLGSSLGNKMYKIRMPNSSKNIGKRSGFRIITYFLDENNILYLVSIYEKNNIENVLIKKLIEIVKKELN